MLDEPTAETSTDLSPDEGRGSASGDPKFADLPLWYAALVEPPARRRVEPEPPVNRLFWRATVARWPIERRQAWGDLANSLQDAGLGWKDAERRAFEQIVSCLGAGRG